MFHTKNKELRDFVNNIVEFNINGHVAENVVNAKYQGVPVGGCMHFQILEFCTL